MDDRPKKNEITVLAPLGFVPLYSTDIRLSRQPPEGEQDDGIASRLSE